MYRTRQGYTTRDTAKFSDDQIASSPVLFYLAHALTLGYWLNGSELSCVNDRTKTDQNRIGTYVSFKHAILSCTQRREVWRYVVNSSCSVVLLPYEQ